MGAGVSGPPLSLIAAVRCFSLFPASWANDDTVLWPIYRNQVALLALGRGIDRFPSQKPVMRTGRFPLQIVSNADVWYSFCFYPEQTIEETIKMPVISDALTPMWCYYHHIPRNVCLCFEGRNTGNFEPETNGRHFWDDIFKYIFLNENVYILIKIHWICSQRSNK